MTDVAAWLKELGLERYEPAFRESEITIAVLPELTEAHFQARRKAGPQQLGDREARYLNDGPKSPCSTPSR
jgi:hypothetical protein